MRIKIRGIYTTALTRFFLDRGMTIVSPSEETAARFEGTDGIEPGGVVHRPGEKEKILDEQAFHRYYRKGYFTKRLFDRVLEEAFCK